MSARSNVITVSLSNDEAAILDERRGSVPRATYLRRVLHGPEQHRDVATRTEAMALLTELAREGRAAATIALARELREGGERDVMDWILSRSSVRAGGARTSRTCGGRASEPGTEPPPGA